MKFRPSRKKKENKKHVFPSQSVFFRMIKKKSFFFFKKNQGRSGSENTPTVFFSKPYPFDYPYVLSFTDGVWLT